MAASEIRQDKVTKRWVIYSPARRKRPKDFRKKESERRNLPVHDKTCPFCPGQDEYIPPLIMEEGKGEQWQVRVIPNKFPALTPEGDLSRFNRGIYLAMEGYGHHEVVIETPLHNRQMGVMTKREIGVVIETYHKRYCDLMNKDENMMITIFRNHGARAGTSLLHPHSQIIATGMVPHYVRWREEEAQHYFDEWGRCVYCDILEQEMRDGSRIVYENRSFVSFVPFAAQVPFETWVIPRRHKADFGDISDEEKGDLSSALRDILGRLHTRTHDPDYNFIINTSVRYRSREPQLHWYLQIRPRLMTMAGFEIGSGMSINTSIPEEDAEFLRSERSPGGGWDEDPPGKE
ncbi:MAG: galactose-1-phosphate uridylyltransferase [Candidatus Sulfobium sp.]